MGLRSVESLSPSLKDIESDLGSEQQRVAMKPFFKFAEEFRGVHLKSENLIDNAEAIRNCHRFTPDQPNATDFMNVESDVKELDDTMETIRTSISKIETNLRAAEAGIIKVRDICAKAEGKKGADLEKVFNEFRNNNDMNETNELSAVVNSLKTSNLTGTDRKETRHATCIAQLGRVILRGYRQLFTSNIIHANDLVLRNGLVLRLTQAPIGNDERGYIV
ncbi:unnamed protein product [Caenorhabditis sp. 36 PRJEB53466]|nr:unnamed protein product [Caenorhabditis sp. 36 PRJEB53466]